MTRSKAGLNISVTASSEQIIKHKMTSLVHTDEQLKKYPTVTTATDNFTRSFEETLDFYKAWSPTYDKVRGL